MRAIILAAGRGSRMQDLTQDKPKCLVKLCNKELLNYQLEALHGAGVREIGIVSGYKKEALEPYIKEFALMEFINHEWADSNMIHSLKMAREWLLEVECCIVSYSDIFYTKEAINALIKAQNDMAILYSTKWRKLWEGRFEKPLSDAESFKQEGGVLREIGKRAKTLDEIGGQYMGLLSFSNQGLMKLFNIAEKLPQSIDSTSLLMECINRGEKISCVPYDGIWGECDNAKDIAFYENFYSKNTLLNLNIKEQ